jgi:integrase
VLSGAVAATEALPASDKEYPEGIRPRHSERCASKRSGGACDCDPPFEASVWSAYDKKKIRKTLPTLQAAIKWRRKHLGLAEGGRLRAPLRITLGETAYAWIEMARAGQIRNRSGKNYKPSALRTLETDFRLRLVPELGARYMSDIERPDLQNLVNRLQIQLSPSKVHGCVNAARVLWRDFDLVTGTNNALLVDPTKGLRLPAVPVGGNDRIATADEARRLIAALDEDDRALWATALYAGMRHGEIRALRANNIDLALKRIKVRAGWDQYEGEIDPKTEKGRRTTVIIELLETLLVEHLKRTGRSGNDLVFGLDIDTRARTPPTSRPARLPSYRRVAHARRGHHHRQGQQVHRATPRSRSPSTATGTCCQAARPRQLRSSTSTTHGAASAAHQSPPSATLRCAGRYPSDPHRRFPSGGGEIRTPGTPIRRTTLFESAAFNHSATPPGIRRRAPG